jgi:hypothetical protein
VSSNFISLVDLVVPPGLLVLYLGIKTAPNKEMPTVFLEALQERAYRGKPTWVVTAPNVPLDSTHRCWSEAVQEFLSDWQTVKMRPVKIPSVVISNGGEEADDEDKTDGAVEDATPRD